MILWQMVSIFGQFLPSTAWNMDGIWSFRVASKNKTLRVEPPRFHSPGIILFSNFPTDRSSICQFGWRFDCRGWTVWRFREWENGIRSNLHANPLNQRQTLMYMVWCVGATSVTYRGGQCRGTLLRSAVDSNRIKWQTDVWSGLVSDVYVFVAR